ncbi:hypothetical protein PIB30_030916 [Stylosanthes scabra]|uniref:Uncharacterized protein n=1 Tax=Stylosanthes scabra TaxID=79078 RepID=A0ABU6Z8J8_9FABA|nr:hypothetical protein [Stylosanthes scabra]
MAPVSAMIFDPVAACFCFTSRQCNGHQHKCSSKKEACKDFIITLDPKKALHKIAIPGPFYRAFGEELGLEMDFFDNHGNRFPVIVKKKSQDSSTFCNGILSIILHYEIQNCALLKGRYLGANRVSFSVLKPDMNPIHPPKKTRTNHGLCLSEMGCVNRLHTELSSHREIFHNGDRRSRLACLDQSEPTLGSLMAANMLGCMKEKNPETLCQSSSMLIYRNDIAEASSSFRFCYPLTFTISNQNQGRGTIVEVLSTTW